MFKKDHKKFYVIEIGGCFQINNISSIDKIYNDKNSILKFCKEISDKDNIYNLKTSLDIDKSKKENIKFNIMFLEK